VGWVGVSLRWGSVCFGVQSIEGCRDWSRAPPARSPPPSAVPPWATFWRCFAA